MFPSKRKTVFAIAAGTALALVGTFAVWPTARRPVVAVAAGMLPLRGGGPLLTWVSVQDVRTAETLVRGIAAGVGCRAVDHAPVPCPVRRAEASSRCERGLL